MSIDLESSLGMFMARQANRRTQDLQQRTQGAQDAARQSALQGSPQNAAQNAAQPGATSASPSAADVGNAGARVDAASGRNECACRAWGDFRQDATSAAVDASGPVSEAQRNALYSADGREPGAAGPSTAAPAAAPAAANGRAQTNQDLINRYYQQGGGTWAGASKAARAEGRTLTELVKNRRAQATPSTSTGNASAPLQAAGSGSAVTSGDPSTSSRGAQAARAASPQRASATAALAPTSGSTAASGAPLSGSAFGNQVAAAAERSARRLNTVGQCALGVNNALTSVGVPGRGHAYQKAGQLAQNPRFREVNVSANALSKLPAGAVVVWGRSADKPWGHVSVALGDGREASDHIQRQVTGGRYGTDFGSGRDPQGRQFRVFVPN
jgi:hypothetical protein